MSEPELQIAGCPQKYEIKNLIGRGGMGIVYHAYDKELQRDVAIKVLWTDGECDENSQARFIREARALGLLSHQNIVQIYASDLTANGHPYFVMELLKGELLSAELKRSALSAARFFEIFEQVTAGLEHAHEKKIAHRDLKPSNIMCCQNTLNDGISGVCKLIDFGIARLELSPEQAAKTITRTDALLGSPTYMSPEQCRGLRGDYLSDIYALGCLMYECISGAPPFDEDTAFETMYKHMSAPAPTLITPKMAPNSKRLAVLVDKCLEKNPSARPQTITELRTELNEIRSSGLEKMDLFSKERKNKTKSKQKAMVFLLSLLLLGMFAGAVMIISLNATKKTPDQALIKKDSEQEKNEKQITRLKRKTANWKIPPLTKENASLCIPHLMNLCALGRYQLRSKVEKDRQDAEKTYAQALHLCQAGGELVPLEPKCLALLAKAKCTLGRFDESQEDFDTALKLAEDLQAKRPSDKEFLMGMSLDILKERCLLRLSQRRFIDAQTEFENNSKYWYKLYGRHTNWTAIDGLQQSLDPQGYDRLEIVMQIIQAVKNMTPKTEIEAQQMAAFITFIAERMSSGNEKVYSKSKCNEDLTFAENLLKNLKDTKAVVVLRRRIGSDKENNSTR